MQKRFAVAGLAAGLTVGSVAGLALGVPSLVSAQTTTTTEPGTTTAPDPDNLEPRPDGGQWLDDTLAPLVENGTITQVQADAVSDAIEAARPERPGVRVFGHGGFGFVAKLDAAAEAIGVTVQELRTALGSGQTLAEVATANGVEPQAVIDALVAELEADLAERVAAGDLTQEEADTRLGEATERITAVVNGELPPRGIGAFFRSRFGDGDRGERERRGLTPPAR